MEEVEDVPHANSSSLSFFESFRAMFYLLAPAESTFEKMSEVPDYVTAATPHFFILIMLEMAILYYKKGKELRLNDKLTCVGAGMYSQLLGLLGLKTIEYSIYVKVYNNYRLYELPWDSAWTWIFMALVYDALYYWFHRMAHEVNFLWNTHKTHHSSEDYTLSTALRQAATQTYASAIFYVPAALLVPPSVHVVHKQLNLLYQFWIHTELVDSLGPLEYVLNTPSHHRVHHGRNPYCIDKNYAAVLIIWDRMFGTFQSERKDEKVVYGLVQPVRTFDSNALQFTQYAKFIERFWQTKGFGNKIRFIFYGPGWVPGAPRLGNLEDIPKIEYPVEVYNQPISNWLNAYVLAHFIVATAIYNFASMHSNALPTPAITATCVFLLASLTCFGYLFDKRFFGPAAEFLRCAVTSSTILRYQSQIVEFLKIDRRLVMAAFAFFMLSTIAWPLIGAGLTREKKKKS